MGIIQRTTRKAWRTIRKREPVGRRKKNSPAQDVKTLIFMPGKKFQKLRTPIPEIYMLTDSADKSQKEQRLSIMAAREKTFCFTGRRKKQRRENDMGPPHGTKERRK